MTGDQLIKFACERAAAALGKLALELGPDRVGERKQLQPEFRKALCERMGDRVSQFEKKHKLPGWTDHLGGVDIIVHDKAGVLPQYFCELKWCHSRAELGWTLWDIYKMIAAQQLPGVHGCYVVAGAPEGFWESEEHCAPLFKIGSWRSLDLFQCFREDWEELLGGGTARLICTPASIETRLVADIPLMIKTKPWRLRAIAVEPIGSERLLFDGDWPVRMAAI